MTYPDRYADGKLSSVYFSKRSKPELLGLSLDAIFPYEEFTNVLGNLAHRLHCPGNIALTTLGNNLGKHISLLGVLHLVKVNWSHLRPESGSLVSVAEVHGKIMNQADEMHQVRLGTPYWSAGRLNSDATGLRFLEHQTEWVTCSPKDKNRRKLLLGKRRLHQELY